MKDQERLRNNGHVKVTGRKQKSKDQLYGKQGKQENFYIKPQ